MGFISPERGSPLDRLSRFRLLSHSRLQIYTLSLNELMQILTCLS